MKKLIFILSLLLVFTLAACDDDEIVCDSGTILNVQGICEPEEVEDLFEYTDFTDIAMISHDQAENISDNKYAVYYYQEACAHCQDVKQEILEFASTFEALDFYILDAAHMPDSSSHEEFYGTPTVFVFSGDEIIEQYVGAPNVRNFIARYGNIQFNYASFEYQHLATYQDILDVEEETYLLYFYLENGVDSIEIESQFLDWAFTKRMNQVYFMNGEVVVDADIIPTDIQILGSGSPIIIVMSNGVYTGEYYLGKNGIIDYIELIGDGDIVVSD